MNDLESRYLRTFLLISQCVCFFISEALCQQRYDVSYYFQRDTIAVTGGQTFSNKIIITNNAAEKITLLPSADNTASLSGMIRLPKEIILETGQTKSLPLKYMTNPQTVTSDNQRFTIALSATDSLLRVQPPESFYIKLQNEHSIIIEPTRKEYYLDPATGQLQLLLRAQNTGLVPQTILPSFSGFPTGFKIIGESLPITLNAGEQSLLTYTASMPGARVSGDFDLRIQALDPAGKVLAGTSVRIMSPGSVKRFGSPVDFQNLPYSNAIALRYIDMGTYSSIYQLQGYGEIDVHEGATLDYRMTLDYYKDQDGLNMYDSYLDYQTTKWGVKLGNIYENLDQSINGRGIKANYNFGSESSLSIYAVQNKYMLFSQMFDFLDGGETFGAKYAIGPQYNEKASITYLHRNDAFRAVNSDLASAKKRLTFGQKHDLLLEGGYSQERSRDNTNHAASVGINYNHTFGPYTLSSTNYYSSPYYSGLKRGLTQSDTRISMLLQNNNRLSARVSYMDNNPSYQNGYANVYFNNANRIQIYELGYLVNTDQIQLEFRPYYMAQRAKYQNWLTQSLLPELAHSASARLAANINFTSGEHRFSMLTDYGYTFLTISSAENTNFHSLKFTGNYNYRKIGFNSYVQLKPYFLSDLFAVGRAANYRVYTLGPNTRFEAFGGRLQTQAAAMYSYYDFSGSNNFSLNADMQWQLTKGWELTAQVYYTFIKGRNFYGAYQTSQPYAPASPNYRFDNRQIRIGIEKNFGRQGRTKGHKLQLELFEDTNNNLVKDLNEAETAGVLVRLGDQAATTDNKGRVKFLDVTPGSHVVQIENNRDWVAQGPINVVVTKNKKLEVPLIITNKVKGSFKVAAKKYMKSAPQLGGIRINAVDTQGRAYHTLSDGHGNFTFYLPQGKYKFSVSSDGMPFSIQNPQCEVIVGEAEDTLIPEFIYLDERRKVGIKHF
ncbi:hypothetical protein [Sphingobacterium sp. JB170]|uniref:hypothetical protein n=1 Tax=Sphingobacterium sp. JB170 TaxID=1434842 RepID=UPI00097E8763|nr:hypothetical protein [Sphingobacterium sp. JB170]SJN19519.1 hypothetical protein FM107_01845 [Sphingobacterium sp. JB170]